MFKPPIFLDLAFLMAIAHIAHCLAPKPSESLVYLGDKAFANKNIQCLEISVYDWRPICMQVVHPQVDVSNHLDLPRQRNSEVSHELADVAVLLEAQNDAALDHLFVDHRHYLDDVRVTQLAV